MSTEMVAFSLWQSDMHMSGKALKEYVDKMVEISKHDPVGEWDNRGLDLMSAAINEVKAEQQKKCII